MIFKYVNFLVKEALGNHFLCSEVTRTTFIKKEIKTKTKPLLSKKQKVNTIITDDLSKAKLFV